MELQKFWNAMDTSFTSTLNENQGLGSYDSLTDKFSEQETIVPPKGHTQRNQAMNAYKNLQESSEIICSRRIQLVKKQVPKHINT